MRKFLVVSALALSFSSMTAFCQQSAIGPCGPVAKPPIASHRPRPREVAPPQAPATVVCATAPAPPPTTVQPSVTVNAGVDLTPLVGPLTTLADAKMNETHTLENLGDVDKPVRVGLVIEYAKARTKEAYAQADYTESQTGLNDAEADFTKKKKKWYVPLHVLDDLSGVAGSYLGATKISSTISTSAAGGDSTGASLNNSTSVVGGGATATTGPVSVSSANTNDNKSQATNTNSDSNQANGGAGGAGGKGGQGGQGGKGGGGGTVNMKDVGNGGGASASASSDADATAKQSQDQSQKQNQQQSQSASQNQTMPAPPGKGKGYSSGAAVSPVVTIPPAK